MALKMAEIEDFVFDRNQCEYSCEARDYIACELVSMHAGVLIDDGELIYALRELYELSGSNGSGTELRVRLLLYLGRG